MGVERAVTRWYIQRQLILEEIAQLDKLLQDNGLSKEASELGHRPPEEIYDQMERARVQLLALGPCPKPMMG